LLRQSTTAAGWTKEPLLRGFTVAGHAGCIEAIRGAAKDLLAGRVQRAIVCAVESLVESDTLEWLEAQGRLKLPTLACGLQPSEAGVAFVMESGSEAAKRKTEVLGTLLSTELAADEATLFSGRVPTGQGLSEILITLARKVRSSGETKVWVVTDQTGETYRAMEWGRAVVAAAAQDCDVESALVWHPAASFGDTAAASGAVGLCVVLRAFARRYAPASHAIILSSSEGTQRAGIVVGPGRN
jgi:3-oxoacyl-(acyl-carrier-protein) synthase